MVRAYRVPVVGKGSGATETARPRTVRGRPNWWVILAVSLALMALLVATAGGPSHRKSPPALGHAAATDAGGAARSHHRSDTPAAVTTTTSTVASGPVTAPDAAGSVLPAGGASSLVSHAGSIGTTGTAPPATTTTAPPATTTTVAGVVQPADRTQTEGYLNPPLQTSSTFDFPGTGAMEVTVVWSGNTYLTMSVSCPSGVQNVGGTSAMEAPISDASGECQATVSEPSSESTALTFTISMGPAGG